MFNMGKCQIRIDTIDINTFYLLADSKDGIFQDEKYEKDLSLYIFQILPQTYMEYTGQFLGQTKRHG